MRRRHRPDRRQSQPRIHHPGRDRRERGVLPQGLSRLRRAGRGRRFRRRRRPAGRSSTSGPRSMPRPPRSTTRRPSPRCRPTTQVSARGIEVGHIFYFGTKYSEPMKAVVAGPGRRRACRSHMGSYGIGPIAAGRRHHRGLPRRCRHHLAGGGRAVQGRDPQPQAGRRRDRRAPARSSIASSQAQGRRRALSTTSTSGPASKFATADLIGIPWQVLVGPKGLADGKVEVKKRADGSREMLTPAAALDVLTRMYRRSTLKLSRHEFVCAQPAR